MKSCETGPTVYRPYPTNSYKFQIPKSGSRFAVRGSRFAVRGSRFAVLLKLHYQQ